MGLRANFWQRFPLSELNDEEWEALCDGCGRCCLCKLEDEDSGDIFYTAVACRELDLESCRCRHYPNRLQRVSDCLDIRQLFNEQPNSMTLLPASCAYRKRAEQQPLADWHPLISGTSGSVRSAGITVQGQVLSEDNIPQEELEDHIIHWVEL